MAGGTTLDELILALEQTKPKRKKWIIGAGTILLMLVIARIEALHFDLAAKIGESQKETLRLSAEHKHDRCL